MMCVRIGKVAGKFGCKQREVKVNAESAAIRAGKHGREKTGAAANIKNNGIRPRVAEGGEVRQSPRPGSFGLHIQKVGEVGHTSLL